MTGETRGLLTGDVNLDLCFLLDELRSTTAGEDDTLTDVRTVGTMIEDGCGLVDTGSTELLSTEMEDAGLVTEGLVIVELDVVGTLMTTGEETRLEIGATRVLTSLELAGRTGLLECSFFLLEVYAGAAGLAVEE